MLIRVIDFESTGIPTKDKNEALVEVGWTDVVFHRDDAEILSPVSMLVNPGRPIPAQASAVHHLRDVDVADGADPTVALSALMKGPPDFFCAHNIDFEKEFFAGGDVPWLCTYKTALRLWPDAGGHKNQELRYHFKFDDDPLFDRDLATMSHRAAPDTYVTAHILRECLGSCSIEDMTRWSKGPALVYMCFFKKHRNTPWHDVPSDYMLWVLDNIQDDKDVRATSRYWLRKREEQAHSKGISNG